MLFDVFSSHDWKVPGLVSFTPNIFVDITDFIDTKKQVLEAYSEEMRESPHSRSIENAIKLNGVRGNAVGFNYVEAVQLVREVK